MIAISEITIGGPIPQNPAFRQMTVLIHVPVPTRRGGATPNPVSLVLPVGPGGHPIDEAVAKLVEIVDQEVRGVLRDAAGEEQ